MIILLFTLGDYNNSFFNNIVFENIDVEIQMITNLQTPALEIFSKSKISSSSCISKMENFTDKKPVVRVQKTQSALTSKR